MILKSFAVVGFFDVGNVYLSSWPKWSDAFVKSLGVGVRYFSFVGPLRLDIGFPLNKRRNVDSDYQIYFSIGQAF
ncbi:MAG: Outer membrane protein assembly factor BamA [Chlamydiae bacterium]|nr:Outer membrane protein assembly factor BamA [Chlamydiota bacterium]